MKKLIILLFVLFCFGCASTNITSITDPDYRGTQVKHLLIVADLKDLSMKQSVEQKFKETMMNNYTVNVSASYDVLPPTREYTEKDLRSIFSKNGIDSVLMLTVTDAGYQTETHTVNQPYRTQGQVTRTGNQYQYQATTSGGPQTYTNNKPYLSMRTEILDPFKKKVIWVATSNSKGNSWVNINFVLSNYINEVAKKLAADGLITPKPKEENTTSNTTSY